MPLVKNKCLNVTIYKCLLMMSQLKKYMFKCDNLQMSANDAPNKK